MQELVDDVKQLRRDVAGLDERAGKLSTQNVKRRTMVGGSLVPDANFSLAAFTGPLLLLLTAIAKMVESNAKEAWPKVSSLHLGNLGPANNAVTAATMQQVGRSVGVYLFILELLGRAFGTSWHITESVRLFDQLRKNMVWDTATIWGVKLSMWRPRSNWKGAEAFDSGPNGISTIRNDKELNLFTGTFGGMVYRFFEMLKSGAEEFRERAEASLEMVLRIELLQALLGGGDLLGYTDRVIHPFTCILNYSWQRARIAEAFPAIYERIVSKLHKEMGDKIKAILPAKAADRVKQCDELVEKMTKMLEDEMGPVKQEVNGKELESYTWAVNVLGVTPERLRNARDEDSFQPLVYVKLLQTLLMSVGVYGLGMFKTADFQRKLSNTQYAATQPVGMAFRYSNEEGWHEPFGWVNHAPHDCRWLDSKGATGAKKFTFKTKNGGKNRTLVSRPHKSGGEHEYFELEKGRWGAEVGPSLMFGPDEMVAYSQETEWGTPENITSRGQDIGWAAGMALREGLRNELFTWD